MKKDILISLRFMLLSIVFFGFLYTLAITGLGYLFFKDKAEGSLMQKNGVVIGSNLIQQKFSDPKFFWGRPSAGNFETVPSGASNYGAINKNFKKDVDDRIKMWKQIYPGTKTEKIPPELLMASGSGLDPHISPEAALFQVDRIIKARSLSSLDQVKIVKLINKNTEKPQLYFLGQPRINVLELNLELERVFNE